MGNTTYVHEFKQGIDVLRYYIIRKNKKNMQKMQGKQ
tara:strand:- start:345 stop:455 length:111 start_codon:yes stop_codon:yes gene_type:complete